MEESKRKLSKAVNQPYNIRSKSNSNAKSAEHPQLCFDNWEVIAGHLDLPDLVNIADVCIDARQAARLAFKRKFVWREFTLEPNEKEVYMKPLLYSFGERVIKKTVTSLKLLRNFGDLILKLEIETKYSSIENDCQLRKVIEYVNIFCAQSRKELMLSKYLPILIENPLQNIDLIGIDTADYSLPEFNSLFKNVVRLYITTGEARDYMCQKLPRLEALVVEVDNSNEEMQITYDDVVKAMQINPHIKRLSFEQFKESDFLEVNINGPEIEIFIDNGKNLKEFSPSRLKEIVQPENFERMIIFHTHLFITTEILKTFQNLKCLILENIDDDLSKLMPTLPKLQNLQIWIGKKHEDFENNIEIFSNIFSSFAPHEKFSTFSFHFENKTNFNEFEIKMRPFINLKIWRITLSEVGPKEYKHSLVLERIESN